jgi:hypothetical protein
MDFQWNLTNLFNELHQIVVSPHPKLSQLQQLNFKNWLSEKYFALANATPEEKKTVEANVLRELLHTSKDISKEMPFLRYLLPYYTSQIRYLDSFLSGGKRTQTRKRNPSRSRSRSRSPVRVGHNATKHKA